MQFYSLRVVDQLRLAGVQLIATELVGRDLSLAGRLQYFIANWEVVTQDQWVLDTAKGFAILFTNELHQPYPPRILDHSAEEVALLEEVESMLAKQAIKRTIPSGWGFLSTLFLVPKKDGGQRPVINLKALNAFVYTEHFKMEGIHVLQNLRKVGDWMVKVDLKDTYLMRSICKEDRALLKFSLKEQAYQFRCLPFGLACA